MVDLKGNTVLPGFYDNHIHLGEAVQEWRGGLVPAASEWLRDAPTKSPPSILSRWCAVHIR